MLQHGSFLKRIWLLPIMVAALVAAHVVVLYRLFSHMAWTVAVGLLVLLALKHIGAIGSVYVMFRRRWRHRS